LFEVLSHVAVTTYIFRTSFEVALSLGTSTFSKHEKRRKGILLPLITAGLAGTGLELVINR